MDLPIEAPRHGHVVLDTRRDEGFTSLRRHAPPRAERYELGRSLRDRSPRSDLAHWRPASGRV